MPLQKSAGVQKQLVKARHVELSSRPAIIAECQNACYRLAKGLGPRVRPAELRHCQHRVSLHGKRLSCPQLAHLSEWQGRIAHMTIHTEDSKAKLAATPFMLETS